MRRLKTVQQIANLNIVFALDEKGPGGACHSYAVVRKDIAKPIAVIQLQKGPRTAKDSINGVLDSDLLEIIKDRLQAFQDGPFACDENEEALKHIECALQALNKRVLDRYERNVLGKYYK